MTATEHRRIAFDAHGEKCNGCEATEDLHVHHRDRDRSNNDPENLEVLCKDCHWDIHGPELAERSRGPTSDASTIVADDMTAEDVLQRLMEDGRVTPAYAADASGYKPSYIRKKLNEMVEHGHAQKVYTGLYELTEDLEDE